MTGAQFETEPPRALPAAPESPDAIGAWLDRLLRITRLPAREAAEIRDELDGHLRERVRDLMLAGHDEPEAIHKSISELGDLALLAQRYREASRTPKGRQLMHITMIAAVGAALGLSSLAFQQSRTPGRQPEAPSPAAVAAEGSAGAQAGGGGERAPGRVPVLDGLPVLSYVFASGQGSGSAISGEMEGGTPLSDLLGFIADSQSLRAYVHWRDLAGAAQNEDEVDALPIDGQTLERAFEMLNDSLGLDGGGSIAFRIDSGLLEVATQRFFDRRERELVTYDVTGLLNAEWPLQVTSESEVLVELVTQIVEPDVWSQNGGDVAGIYAVGDVLFVNAPPRVHERIAWLLSQLMERGQEDASVRERTLREFVTSAITSADPAAGAARVDARDLLNAAQALPEAADPSVQHALREAIETLGVPCVYPLSYTAATELEPILAGALAPIGGEVTADSHANSLIVVGSAGVQAKAGAILRALDRDPNAAGEAAPEAVTPGGEGEPTSLQLRAVDGRILAELRQGDQVSRIEATALEVTAASISGFKASEARFQMSDRPMRGLSYTIEPGDTLASIAARFLGHPSSVEEILRANPGLRGDDLAVGRQILVPDAATVDPEPGEHALVDAR